MGEATIAQGIAIIIGTMIWAALAGAAAESAIRKGCSEGASITGYFIASLAGLAALMWQILP